MKRMAKDMESGKRKYVFMESGRMVMDERPPSCIKTQYQPMLSSQGFSEKNMQVCFILVMVCRLIEAIRQFHLKLRSMSGSGKI